MSFLTKRIFLILTALGTVLVLLNTTFSIFTISNILAITNIDFLFKSNLLPTTSILIVYLFTRGSRGR